MSSKVTIYCDGSCNNHDHNKGGYGVVIISPSGIKQYCGGSYINTTSARMELLGALRALSKCTPGDTIELWCDNQYVVNSLEKGWIFKWERQKWLGRKNEDLLKLILKQYRRLETKVTFRWLKGHAGSEYNELADRLADRGANRIQIIKDNKY